MRLVEKQARSGVNFALERAGDVYGRVIRIDGTPAKDARVMPLLILERLPRDRAAIDHDGRFHLKGLFGTRALRLIGTQRDVDRMLRGKTPIETVTLGVGERIDDLTIVAIRQ